MWETEVTRVVGALISVGGVAVASPPGTRHAAALLRASTHHGWEKTLQTLRKVLGLPPKNTTLYPANAMHAQGGGSGNLLVTGAGIGMASPTIEDRVRLLEEHLQRVDKSLITLQRQADEDRAAQQAALTALRDQLTASIAALTARLDASEERAMQTDARALVIAVFGILLLNFAAEVATLPFALWAFVLVASVVGCVYLGRAAWRAGTHTAD